MQRQRHPIKPGLVILSITFAIPALLFVSSIVRILAGQVAG